MKIAALVKRKAEEEGDEERLRESQDENMSIVAVEAGAQVDCLLTEELPTQGLKAFMEEINCSIQSLSSTSAHWEQVYSMKVHETRASLLLVELLLAEFQADEHEEVDVQEQCHPLR